MTGKMRTLHHDILRGIEELHSILGQVEANRDKIAYLKGLLAKEDFKRRAIA